MNINCANSAISNVRINYSWVPIVIYGSHGHADFRDCQFVNIDYGIDALDTDVNLYNVLFQEIIGDNPVVLETSGNLNAQNVTCDGYVTPTGIDNNLVAVSYSGTHVY